MQADGRSWGCMRCWCASGPGGRDARGGPSTAPWRSWKRRQGRRCCWTGGLRGGRERMAALCSRACRWGSGRCGGKVREASGREGVGGLRGVRWRAGGGRRGGHGVWWRSRAGGGGREGGTEYGAVAVMEAAPGSEVLLDGGVAGRTGADGGLVLASVPVGQREVRVHGASGTVVTRVVSVVRGRTVAVTPGGAGSGSPSQPTLTPAGKNAEGFEEYRRVRD